MQNDLVLSYHYTYDLWLSLEGFLTQERAPCLDNATPIVPQSRMD